MRVSLTPYELRKNIGEYKIKKSGEYILYGVVKGNITVDISSRAHVIIRGANKKAVLRGKRRNTTRRKPGGHIGRKKSDSHIRGRVSGNSTLEIHDFKIIGDGQNAISVAGKGRKIYRGLVIENHNANVKFSAGGINGGENSLIEDVAIVSGDDAVKPTERKTVVRNSTIRMKGNGSAIQFGWAGRSNGRSHYVENVKIYGHTTPHWQFDDWSDRPGRALIGGVFQGKRKKISDIKISGLDVRSKKFAHIIKFIAKRGVVLRDVYIGGTLRKGIQNADNTHTAIVIRAESGARIRGMVIDLGEQANKTKFHNICGNVDVKFVRGPHYRGGRKCKGPNSGSKKKLKKVTTLKRPG